MKPIVFVISIFFAKSIYAQKVEVAKNQPVFAYADITSAGFGGFHCDAYFSDSTKMDMIDILHISRNGKMINYTQTRFKLLAYFYDKGYELIGVTNDCADAVCSNEFYFKLKEQK